MVTRILSKPAGKCLVCQQQDWWTPDGGVRWYCRHCRPDPHPAQHPQPSDFKCSNPEVEALRARVAAGNEKLIHAFLQFQKMPDGPEADDFYKAWSAAETKLQALAKELRKSYVGCLYTGQEYEQEKQRRCNSWPEGMFCLVCGDSDLLWESVIARAPGPRRSKTPAPEEVIEFLKTLGGKI